MRPIAFERVDPCPERACPLFADAKDQIQIFPRLRIWVRHQRSEGLSTHTSAKKHRAEEGNPHPAALFLFLAMIRHPQNLDSLCCIGGERSPLEFSRHNALSRRAFGMLELNRS